MMKRWLPILFALALVLRLDTPASANTVSPTFDQAICTANAVAAAGGTMTCSYATTTDRCTRLVALVGATNLSGSHLNASAFVTCEAVYENKNGTVSAVTAITNGVNPTASTSTTFILAHAQGSDPAFHNPSGGTDISCAWSISGTNAVVTVTNPSTTSTTADVTVLLQAFTYGSQ